MLHSFPFPINCEELPQQFTYPFCYTPHPLVEWAAKYVSERYRDKFMHNKCGKMMGVMVVCSADEQIGFLVAYSGEMNDESDFFVPPIVNYSDPQGYFMRQNNGISEINKQIATIETSPARQQLVELVNTTISHNEEAIDTFKQQIKQRKLQRSELRAKGGVTAETEQQLIKQSQFDKAELKRLEQRLASELAPLRKALEESNRQLADLKAERHKQSVALQEWLFEQYTLLDANGCSKKLDDIFKAAGRGVPPSGAGDCCAPRLLQYAYTNNMKPIAMGEFWIGVSPQNVVRVDGQFYPSCQRKCKPILTHMLGGLSVEPNPLQKEAEKSMHVVYEDQWIIVVNKPGGLQSIPGLTTQDSVAMRLQLAYPNSVMTPAHRLDQFTSGLLIVAKSKDVLAALHRQFEERQVKKRYVALLEHRPIHDSGIINLPIGFDPDDSCKRIVDRVEGKDAITKYRVIGERKGYTLVEFFPETGRTHQLRIHSAHPDGLNAPIVGDGLYGIRGDVMYLCSCGIQFTHPITADFIKLELPESDWFC